jgi:hypothetical protein
LTTPSTAPLPEANMISRHVGIKRGAALVLSVLGAVLLVSCVASSSAKDKHAVFHGCSSGEVQLQELQSSGHTRFKTTGCGHEERFSCIGAKCRSGRILVVRQYAAEQKCKLNKVETEEPEPGHFVAQGCGKTVGFVCQEVPNEVLKCEHNK